jgi:hypothetical protein
MHDAVTVGCEIGPSVGYTVKSTVIEEAPLAEMAAPAPGIDNAPEIVALTVVTRALGLRRN